MTIYKALERAAYVLELLRLHHLFPYGDRIKESTLVLLSFPFFPFDELVFRSKLAAFTRKPKRRFFLAKRRTRTDDQRLEIKDFVVTHPFSRSLAQFEVERLEKRLNLCKKEARKKWNHCHHLGTERENSLKNVAEGWRKRGQIWMQKNIHGRLWLSLLCFAHDRRSAQARHSYWISLCFWRFD